MSRSNTQLFRELLQNGYKSTSHLPYELHNKQSESIYYIVSALHVRALKKTNLQHPNINVLTTTWKYL